MDTIPTMCDFAGIQVPAKLKGHSLKSIALGKPISQWRDYVVIQNNVSQTPRAIDSIIPKAEGRMVRSDRFKYCV